MRSSTDIQADLDAAYIARRTALSAQEYSLDTGQGKQSVKRASLSDINKTIRELELELAQANDAASGDNGIVSGIFQRYY
jgi:hypothetical protein